MSISGILIESKGIYFHTHSDVIQVFDLQELITMWDPVSSLDLTWFTAQSKDLSFILQ